MLLCPTGLIRVGECVAVRCSPWPSADARLCLIDASPPEQHLIGAPDSTRFPFNHSDITKNPQIHADVPSVRLERCLTHTHTLARVTDVYFALKKADARVYCMRYCNIPLKCYPPPTFHPELYESVLHMCEWFTVLLSSTRVILWEYNYVFDLPCLLLPRSHISLCPSVTLTLMSLCEEHRSGCEKTSAVIVQLLYWYCRLRISMYDFAKIIATNTTLILFLVFQKYYNEL